MKHNFLSLLLFISTIQIFISCQEKKRSSINDGVYPTSSTYSPSKLIDSISKIFIDSSNCDQCLNELYIDKVYEDEVIFTFKAKPFYPDFFDKKKPLLYFETSGRKIFIFTGAEDFFKGNLNNIDTSTVSTSPIENHSLLMAFHLINDSIELIKIANLPFTPQLNQNSIDTSLPKFDPTNIPH